MSDRTLIWYYHVSLAHPRAQDFLALLEAQYSTAVPGGIFSVVQKLDGTEALVKLAGATPEFKGKIPGNIRNAIIAEFDPIDPARVALYLSPGWPGAEIDTRGG